MMSVKENVGKVYNFFEIMNFFFLETIVLKKAETKCENKAGNEISQRNETLTFFAQTGQIRNKMKKTTY